MNYRQLGSSSLRISEIGFGCMSLKGDYAENERIVNTALDSGINFFDTADLYDKGENEKLIGSILKDKRGQVKLATKVGNQWRNDGSGWDWNPRKEYILSAVEESLRRLQTDYIDLYQLHGGTIDDPIDETIEAFEILQQQGKILYYGISSIRPNVIREYVSKSNIVSVMMQYSLLDRRPEEKCLDLLKKNNIGVLVRGSLAQGLLVDKPAKAYLNHKPEQVECAVKAIDFVSKSKRSHTQTALQFVLRRSTITSAVVGVRTLEQLADVVQTVNTEKLTDFERAFLKDSIKQTHYEEHR
jgi:aryl-alcohol dehydrogenase-like predicted oxidoreductase